MHDRFPVPPAGFLRQATAPLAKNFGLSTLPFHSHEIFFAFLAYNALFSLVAPTLSHRFSARTYRTLSKKTRIDWNVRVTSVFQSTFITVAALTIMLVDRPHRATMCWQERLWGYDGASGMVQAFAAGYFLWDVQVSCIHLDVLGVGSLFHAVSALVITLLGFRPFANYYGIHFVLYEMSTPFLNIHWFLDKLGRTGSTFQLINGITLIVTFGCTRLLWGSYQSALVYTDLWTAWNFVKTDPKIALILNTTADTTYTANTEGNTELAAWLALLYLVSNTVLCILNFYWFGLMISSVKKRFVPAQDGKRANAQEATRKKVE